MEKYRKDLEAELGAPHFRRLSDELAASHPNDPQIKDDALAFLRGAQFREAQAAEILRHLRTADDPLMVKRIRADATVKGVLREIASGLRVYYGSVLGETAVDLCNVALGLDDASPHRATRMMIR